MEAVIECKGLTHFYGKRKIYENLNFQVPRGRILGLLGKNGTGKTTTINILSGFLAPKQGECLVFGENIREMKPATRARIGLLIEGHVQYPFMTISQIERFYAAFYPKWRRDAYYALMSKLRTSPRQRIANMSCGQRSQVALGLIFGVVDEFQKTGVQGAMIKRFCEVIIERKGSYDWLDMSWVGDFNPKMMHLMEYIGASVSQTYVTYRKLFRDDIPFCRSIDKEKHKD